MTTPPYDAPETEPVPPDPGAPASGGAPAASRSTRNRSGAARLVNVALGAALLIGVAGVAFAAGRFTGPGAEAATVSVIDAGTLPDGGQLPGGGGIQRGNGQPPDGVVPGVGGRNFVFDAGGPTLDGTVDSVTADSITVKLESGQTITVGLSADTTYHQQADADAGDVRTGGRVVVRITGGFGPDGGGTGSASLGTASDVTIVP
jgi:hypothetical protein